MLTDVDIVVGQPHGIKSDSPQDILYLIYSVTALGLCPYVRLSVRLSVRSSVRSSSSLTLYV